MAKTTNTKTSTKKKSEKSTVETAPVMEEVESSAVVEEVEIAAEVQEPAVEEVKKEPRKFENEDMISCLCMFPGFVSMTGRKTRNIYTWEDMGTTEYIEYQDLKSEVMNKQSIYIYRPLIVVQDEDFLAQFPTLAAMYEEYYTPEEIMDQIITLTPERMAKFIEALPAGIKPNIKNIAATMIRDGQLDSVRKIKVIDDIFGTQLRDLSYE